MLDINLIQSDKKRVEQALLKRMDKELLDLDLILDMDSKRRAFLQKVNELKEKRNKFSKAKPDAKTIKEMRALGEKIREFDQKIYKIEVSMNASLSKLPNIPDEDVPSGGKDNNKVLKIYGKVPQFSFRAKDHMQLARDLFLIDYERGAKIAGSGFWVYTRLGAELEWALLNYFVDFHRRNGYAFLIPPFLLTEQSAFTSGHVPRFRDDLYWTQDQLCLNATSEMMLGNFHRDEILLARDLPLKYFAFSACFRREAGSYRKEERGMIRGHQFNKIEMFQFSKPKDSPKAFTELLDNAVQLVKDLGLHFRTVLLAAGDSSDAMAKTVDVEVFLPSIDAYKEVSSVSNARDYQARRGKVRYKNVETGKNEFVHTLNASGLATSRLLPAIVEQFQQKDGSVRVPKVLKKYIGVEVITSS